MKQSGVLSVIVSLNTRRSAAPVGGGRSRTALTLTGPDCYLEMLLLIVCLGAIFIGFIFPHVCFSLKMSRRIYAAEPVKQCTSDNCAIKKAGHASTH